MTVKTTRITIPAGLDFSALKIARNPSGGVVFDWTPIDLICAESGIDVKTLRESDEGNVAELIANWYAAHIEHGGARDMVMDDLLSEAAAEADHGAGLSFPPGRA